ncbi:unnamed protein product, partial [Anisakis simplex]|uniref:MFS domain-containing protein n=1 Tax=Anisakis simplex TaxID=6269 RepID=A0A0M3K1Q9_ANISI
KKIEDGSESCDEASSSTQFPEPLDGGYGWVIVFASFCIHFICDGISFSFGIMFPEIQQYFKATKTMSGVVGSIFLSIPLLSGPLAAVLTDIYDCRMMTFVGGVVAASGSFLSFFAFDITHFMLTFAIITGIGLSFCYNTAIVAVTYYFQKKRALATGIAVCGSGVGTFVFAPIIEVLFNKFGWRITLIFIGFLLLLLVGCAAIMKDLEWPQDTLEYKKKKFIEKTEKERARQGFGLVTEEIEPMNGVVYSRRRAISLPELSSSVRWYLQRIQDTTSNIQLVRDVANEMQECVSRSKSVGTFLRSATNNFSSDLQVVPSKINSNGRRCLRWNSVGALERGSDESVERDCVISRHFSLISERQSDDSSTTQSNEGDAGSSRFLTITAAESKVDDLERQKREDEPLLLDGDDARLRKNSLGACVRDARAMPRFATMLSGVGTAQGRVPASNIITYPTRINNDICLFALNNNSNNMHQRVPSAPAIFFRRKRKSRRHLQIAKMLESTCEWLSVTKSLLLIPTFLMFLVSTFVLYIFFDIPYVNFPEYAVEHLNVTQTTASYLVSSIGFMNTISMLLCGFLADWKKTREQIIVLYGVFIVLAGCCVVLTPFVNSYLLVLMLCSGYGFFISANYVLASVITVHLLCLYDFQTGYGLLCLVEGLGNLIGPALVGFIHDTVGTYRNIFLVGGCGTIFSGLLVLFIEVYLRVHASECDENGHQLVI